VRETSKARENLNSSFCSCCFSHAEHIWNCKICIRFDNGELVHEDHCLFVLLMIDSA
jgi:hypothetical protein